MSPTGLIWQERQSPSRLIGSVWTCRAPAALSRTVIADASISISLVKNADATHVVIRGPATSAGSAELAPGHESMTIRLKPGVFLPNVCTRSLSIKPLVLPADVRGRFSLDGLLLQFPGFYDAESFIQQLFAKGHLKYENVSDTDTLERHRQSRSFARKVLHATGLSPYRLYQIQRMHEALRLLKQGMPASHVAAELAFVDQPHFIRASKRFFGSTPKHLPILPHTP